MSYLWKPTESQVQNSLLKKFTENLELKVSNDFEKLWKWTVENPEVFWSKFWDFSKPLNNFSKINVGLFRDLLTSLAFATFGSIVHSFSLGGTFLRLWFFSFAVKRKVSCEVAANKGAGSQFGEAVSCIGVDLKPNPASANYEDFCFVEGRSGLGSAFEAPKSLRGIGAGVRGRYWGWDETHF